MAPKARNIQDKAFENRVPCSRRAAKAGSATIAMTRHANRPATPHPQLANPLPGHVHAPFPQVAFRLRLPEAEEGDGLSGVTGVASQAGREVRDAGQLHDADGEVAPGGHRAGRVAGPQLGGVSGKVVSRTWCRALMPQWSRTSRAS
jgi:hypothetical protein